MANELMHYGIPGMKWGVRRFQNKDGSLTNAGKKRRVDKMSDDELRSQLNRLRMEDEYKRLTKKEVGKGKKAVDKLIKAGTTVATVTTTAIVIQNNLKKLGIIK